ncbi:MAG: hypothetical protein ACQEQL_03950 [Pseudomonadota bacterium]
MWHQLKSIMAKAAQSAANHLSDKDLFVVFGGFYQPGEQPSGKSRDAEFRLYLLDANGCADLPARAGNEAVAQKISKMKLGQVFRIVSERSDGGLGPVLDKIEMRKDFPVHNLKDNKFPF